jgi:hypothetical protein
VSARVSTTRVWRAVAMVVFVAIGVSCGDTKSGPNTPISIEFFPPELPSILNGDVLHDTLGNVDSLRAVAFNSAGDTIQGAPVKYVHADTTTIVTIDATTGHVMAVDTGSARVVAQAGTLQSPPETLFVVLRPDLFASITALNDSFITAPVTDSIFPLSSRLTSAATSVDHYRIEYSIIYPPNFNNSDSTHVVLTDENRKFSLIDTTATDISGFSGATTRYLRISPAAHTFADTVVVEARAFYPDRTPIPGSPQRFKVFVQNP